MSSLVERLRESKTQARALDRSELLEEAAVEIERLAREVAFHAKTLNTFNAVQAWKDTMPLMPRSYNKIYGHHGDSDTSRACLNRDERDAIESALHCLETMFPGGYYGGTKKALRRLLEGGA